MNPDLEDLYQEIILGHNKRPHHEGELDPCTCQAEGYNPLCGDKITVYVRQGDDGKIEAVNFTGEGCAISRASASIMTDQLRDLTPDEARAKVRELCDLLTGPDEPDADLFTLGDLVALVGVRKFPARIKCATLAWHAFDDALTRGD